MCSTSSSSSNSSSSQRNNTDDSHSGGSRKIAAPLAEQEQIKEAELILMEQPVGAGLVAKRPTTLVLPPLKMPLNPPGFNHSPSLGGESTASSLAAARMFKPVTISFKDLSYSVRTGIFRKG